MTRVVSKSPSMIPVKVHPDAVFLFGQAVVALRQACYYKQDRVARSFERSWVRCYCAAAIATPASCYLITDHANEPSILHWHYQKRKPHRTEAYYAHPSTHTHTHTYPLYGSPALIPLRISDIPLSHLNSEPSEVNAGADDSFIVVRVHANRVRF